MYYTVLNETRTSTEGLPTLITPKGLFSSVNSLMQTEIGIEPKSLPTFIALKWFVPSVDSLVKNEI